tara:strand:+ start:486 stop:614 length:129 start_codon:yes stop_codon:yes gene_type:complete
LYGNKYYIQKKKGKPGPRLKREIALLQKFSGEIFKTFRICIR